MRGAAEENKSGSRGNTPVKGIGTPTKKEETQVKRVNFQSKLREPTAIGNEVRTLLNERSPLREKSPGNKRISSTQKAVKGSQEIE